MSKGRTYDDGISTIRDAASGRLVHRLTNYRGHSSHLYFTDPCWIDGGRSFVFVSDREGRSNLFRYDFPEGGPHALGRDGRSGLITQLTDLEGDSIENERVFDHRPQGAYSEAKRKYYYWWRNVLHELDVFTLAERVVHEADPAKVLGIHATTSSDGRYICNAMRDRVENDTAELEYPYFKFPELHPAQPLTQITRVEIATGKAEVVHEDRRFITHVNHSPVLPHILTFCHEGPWDRVAQRIWGLDLRTGATWKIRPQDDGRYAIGHEYWFADGIHIGYHGAPRPGADSGLEHVFGYASWDNTERFEVRFPFHSTHFASNDDRLIVGDGTAAVPSGARWEVSAQPYIQLFRREGDRYSGPRVLATHRCTFNHQHSHCHPRFTPDGSYVLFATDATGYANIYLTAVGDFDDLPKVSS